MLPSQVQTAVHLQWPGYLQISGELHGGGVEYTSAPRLHAHLHAGNFLKKLHLCYRANLSLSTLSLAAGIVVLFWH